MIAMSAPEPNGKSDAGKEAGPLKRRANPLTVAKTVLSGFFGVGRRAHHESVRLTPVQIIVAGLIAAAVFVGSLLLLVSFILSRVGAGAGPARGSYE
jgi:hypothetical protein